MIEASRAVIALGFVSVMLVASAAICYLALPLAQRSKKTMTAPKY